MFTASFLVLFALGHANAIEWYRTAKWTGDRLTKQPDIQFGKDLPSNVTVTIDR